MFDSLVVCHISAAALKGSLDRALMAPADGKSGPT